MSSSLLFLPDISGFTKFVQNTEVSHSQHIIAELLELLIASNTIDMDLVEIEGDALFFFKAAPLPTKEEIEAQIERMMTVFYSHLRLLQKNRICPCQACITAPELELKIIAHCGLVQFMKIQGTEKPFGPEVIQAHRLMKNSVQSDRYVLLSEKLTTEIGLFEDREESSRTYVPGKDNYDDVDVGYFHHHLEPDSLDLIPFPLSKLIELTENPSFSVQHEFPVSATAMMEHITDYRQRPHWTDGLDDIVYNEEEVTRLDTEHTCVLNAKTLKFTAVTKEVAGDQFVYGELTTSIAPMDRVYIFYHFHPIDDASCTVNLEVYIQVDLFLKKPIVWMASPMFKKSMKQGLERLHAYVTPLHAIEQEAPDSVQ